MDGKSQVNKAVRSGFLFFLSVKPVHQNVLTLYNPSIQVQFSHKGSNAKTNNNLSGI